MRRLFQVGVLLAAFTALHATELPWEGTLSPRAPGSFPPLKPFTGEFTFGWSNIEAGSAKATFKLESGRMTVDVKGGSFGWARTLWQLDATNKTILSANGLTPISFRQVETYSNRTVTTEAEWRQDALWRLRKVKPDPENKAKWKRVNINPIYDMVSGMLFIRSQALATGDKVRLIVFPGDSAFLADITVLAHEKLRVGEKMMPAIKIDFSPQKITRNDGGGSYRLEPYTKFKRGVVWISDDEYRVPLRAEVNIFIGFVYGELKYANFQGGTSLP